MEFNFRAIDGKYSTYAPRLSTSSASCFLQQALRGGRYSGPSFGNEVEYFRIPNPMEEVVQREIEKKWIRKEIIDAEIAWRRVLEEEVRRDMIVEGHLALRRGGHGFSILSGFEPRLSGLHQSEGRSLEETIALLEERPGNGDCRSGFEAVPFQRSTESKITDVKPTSDVVSKEKVIFLTKPEVNSFGVKCKAVSPPATGATKSLSVGSKKKLKAEWRCTICQVTASSEIDLKEHLHGKKHKSKVEGQRNYAIRISPKKMLGNSKKKRFKLWCKICKVGAVSKKMMNKHNKGNKHLGRLQWIEKSSSRSKASVPKAEEEEETRENENVDEIYDGKHVEDEEAATDSDW